ncbi:hypothetical protein Afil01_09210 [Actinorhabdospora filicis]|uniref:EF-hand domain-containing protein n=1 Tax=Actinorhabdospora filicis TaxID=1785913 RepID=A0A9W6W723_9ACTN|nr:hypothetical protein [Actinorhabdospora filicis]GLZ76114.1 hypothetical protein Afil01_09210 [Actinorhabdospora filicis]
MASEFQTRKLIRRFGLLDTDHRGRVELADYLRIAERLRCSLELEDGHPGVLRLRKAYERLWGEVLGADGELGLEAFIAAMDEGAVTDPAGFDKAAQEVWERLFDLCDQNGDDEIGLPLVRLLLRAHGLVEPQIDVALGHIVPDGRALSRERFGVLCREFFTGDDREASGNWLFGDPRPLLAGL